jgi:hypothetical protein
MRVPVRNVSCWKGGTPPKAEGLTSWWVSIVCKAMLSFSAGFFKRIFCDMSNNGAGRHLLHFSNDSPLVVFPLKSLSWKNRSNATTEQATFNVFSVSRAFGMNSSSSFFCFLLLLIVLSFLLLASRARCAEFERRLESPIALGWLSFVMRFCWGGW